MAKVGFELTPESKRLIKEVLKAGKIDLRPAFIPIKEGYRKEIEMIFDHQQPRNEGLRWKPLSRGYASWKEKHFPGKPILERTGKLKKSMTKQGAPGNITLIGAFEAIFGSSVPYGADHDEGRLDRNLPQRNFSEPGEGRLKIFREDIEDHIIHQMRLNGIEVKKGIFL